MKVKCTTVRLAFPALHKPKPVGDGDPRYSLVAILEPGSDADKKVAEAVKDVAVEKWGKKADAVLADLRKRERCCYLTTPKTNKSGDVYDGFDGMHSISASSEIAPLVIGPDRRPLTSADGKPYAGCYINLTLDIWAQDNQFGRRINAKLGGVQFVRDGDAFSGGVPTTVDDFEDLSADEEETADSLL